MQWENLTATEFAQAVRDTGVCIIAMGVVEKHSEHLPLGTDYLNGHKIACLAAEKEAAVVFPPFYFGQIYEARCFPGTITIPPNLLFDLCQALFDEIGRNGFKKIIVLNAHGGNMAFLQYLLQCSLWAEKPYHLYMPIQSILPDREEDWQGLLETTVHGHACEIETGITLANHPELVKMGQVPEEPALGLGRMKDLPPTYNAIWWYADFPDHYAGDARTITREKGLAMRQLMVDSLAKYIAAVKSDKVVPALTEEFFRRVEQEVGV